MNLTSHTLVFTQTNKVITQLHTILRALDFDISSEERANQTFEESILTSYQISINLTLNTH